MQNAYPISRRESFALFAGTALLLGCRRKWERTRAANPMPKLPVRVRDEFGTLRTAIVHDGSNAVDVTWADWKNYASEAELKAHPETAESSKAKLIEQHRAFRTLLKNEDVELLSPETQPDAFCQVFARDPCFAIGDTLFIAGLRDKWRHTETTGLQKLRARFERVVDLSGDGALIEGGDVMALRGGQLVLVGMNRHTNEAGLKKLKAALPTGVEVVAVPHAALHLDCCVAPLPNGGALFSAEKLPKASQDVLKKHFKELTALEPAEAAKQLAANLFWLDKGRVVSGLEGKVGKTNQKLKDLGYKVIELDFSDLVALWGSFRCVVCPLVRE